MYKEISRDFERFHPKNPPVLNKCIRRQDLGMDPVGSFCAAD